MIQKLKDWISTISDAVQLYLHCGGTAASLLGALALVKSRISAAIFLAVIAVLVACYGLYKWCNPKYISLSEASRIIYQKFRRKPFGEAVERMNAKQSTDGVLEIVAGALSQRTDIYGTFPPSWKREKLDTEEFSRGAFSDGGDTLTPYGAKTPRYIDLQVRRRDIRKAIKNIRSTYGT